jgi:hypothetical protein
MASLVLKMSVSLDGYVAPVDGSTDWIAAGGSADGLSWTVETVSNAGAHLIGAATYAGWAGYWPGASAFGGQLLLARPVRRAVASCVTTPAAAAATVTAPKIRAMAVTPMVLRNRPATMTGTPNVM